ncbi:MAG: hypothetical protein OXD43_12405 [Bacteroidetes bacterium]|nr:hypothetical protein [Bacteroidota bacterium]
MENAKAAEGLLMNLVNQGLRYDQKLVCVIDGAEELHKTVHWVF